MCGQRSSSPRPAGTLHRGVVLLTAEWRPAVLPTLGVRPAAPAAAVEPHGSVAARKQRHAGHRDLHRPQDGAGLGADSSLGVRISLEKQTEGC